MTLIKSPSFLTAPKSWFSPIAEDEMLLNDEFFKRNTLPAANVKENENNFEIELAAPGFKKEEITAEVVDCVLTVSGESKSEEETTEENYTRKEFQHKSFSRSFSLPDNANPDAVTAKYENGLLKLQIAKIHTEELTRNKVEVK